MAVTYLTPAERRDVNIRMEKLQTRLDEAKASVDPTPEQEQAMGFLRAINRFLRDGSMGRSAIFAFLEAAERNVPEEVAA